MPPQGNGSAACHSHLCAHSEFANYPACVTLRGRHRIGGASEEERCDTILVQFRRRLGHRAAATGVTRFLAGGTDVLVQLRSDLVTPDDLIDIKQIAGVRDITRRNDGGWRIGAAVSGAELAEHAALIAEWPGVVEALELNGSTQIQARCTLVGNLCNGSPAADSVPAMIAAGASVSVVGPVGEREIAVEDVPSGPGMTSLDAGEVVSAVTPAAARRGRRGCLSALHSQN